METYFGEIEQARSHIARERALTDLQTLTRDTEDLLNATAHDESDKARAARSRITAALERAKSSISELQEQAVVTAKVAAKRTELVIREHPYESIGVAFGVGLLLGVLATRGNQPGGE